MESLSIIANEGVSKMAEYMYEIGGDYSVYESWATKLLDKHIEEATKDL